MLFPGLTRKVKMDLPFQQIKPERGTLILDRNIEDNITRSWNQTRKSAAILQQTSPSTNPFSCRQKDMLVLAHLSSFRIV